MQPGLALSGEPGHPPVRALAGDPHRFSNIRDRHPGLDPRDQQSPAMERQTSITVGHEDLRTVEDDTSPTAPGGLPRVKNQHAV